MTRRLKLAWIPFLAAVLLLPEPARAEFPSPAVYVGVFGGGQLRFRDWDLGDHVNGIPGSRWAGDVGLRLGVHVLPQLALEVELGYIPLDQKGTTNHVLAYDIELLYHFLKGNWSPFVSAGFGAYSNLSDHLGKDTDPRGHVGIGVRGLVLPWMAIRLDIRDVISDGMDKGGSNNLELLAGIDFFVWRAKKAEAKPADRDQDGIVDADDACPDDFGLLPLKGCPDRDQDGIPDKDDACPDQPGPATTKGCPDTDKDGIPDMDDACPTEAGPAATKGCPDKDGDGIPDGEDRCPEAAGPKNLKGCPDRDRDGVADIDDKCPDQTGLKAYEGCVPEKAAKFTGAIKGINFATGSAKILAGSFKVLDRAVKVLAEFPELRLRIEGHTDSTGSADLNRTLSQQRAEAVRDYLVKKGIAADRLQAAGFGPDKPIADNATAKGRAANRRTEFTLLGVE